MIKIKAWFGDWKEVDKEQAKKFVKHFIAGIVTTSDMNKKIEIVEGHLQGITVKEVLK
jgi:hypothetical protein